jgi:hypothetical protein
MDPVSGHRVAIGRYKFGVYAFYDYDGEPIYVGQTSEGVSLRIARHLTNQRTDAVAMKVLDPFEVCDIQVWPLPQFEGRPTTDPEARAHLNWLENNIYQSLLSESRFKAVLNEKEPPPIIGQNSYARPETTLRGCVVSEEVRKLRGHSDTRIARRSETLASLAKVISERQVQKGLRQTLLTQARRLAWLAEQRLADFAGEPIAKEGENDSNEEPRDEPG